MHWGGGAVAKHLRRKSFGEAEGVHHKLKSGFAGRYFAGFGGGGNGGGGILGAGVAHIIARIFNARAAEDFSGGSNFGMCARPDSDIVELKKNPVHGQIAAVSVGIYRGTPLLDLDYDEDSQAETDMNVVMNDAGRFVEVQGTAEGHAFDRAEFDSLLGLAGKGVGEILELQLAAVESAGTK